MTTHLSLEEYKQLITALLPSESHSDESVPALLRNAATVITSHRASAKALQRENLIAQLIAKNDPPSPDHTHD